MLGIMAGMDQEAWFAGFDVVPRAVLLLVSQAPDARHHGRRGPQDSVEVHRCSSWTRFSPCPLLCYECRGPDSALHSLAFPALAVLHGRRFSCCGTEAYSMQTIVFPQLLRYMCSTSPVMQAVQFPRWFVVLGHADDMPVVGNNRCLELDSVVLQSFCSCSSLVVGDISVVAGAGSYGPDCQCVGPTGVGCVFVGVSPVPVAGPFLVLQYIIEYIIWFRVFFAQHRDSRRFRLGVPILSHAYGLLQEFIPVVFDYRGHDLRCGGLLLLLGQGQQGLRDHGVVGGGPGWCSGRFGL